MKISALCLPALLTLITSACQKEACIKGVVLDYKTDQPISGVELRLGYDFTEMGSLKFQLVYVTTDASGRFSHEAEKNSVGPIHLYEAHKTGYAEMATSEWSSEKCPEVVVKLKPLDGALKLLVSNETGSHDSIFVHAYSKCRYLNTFSYQGNPKTNPYPLKLKKGEEHAALFSTCTGDSIVVFWKFLKTATWAGTESIFVSSTDTVYYKIGY